jgi:hypothetical protein
MVCTDSWQSIAGAGCGLICVGAGEELAHKVYALRGLRGVERQVGLTRGTQWSRCRVAAPDRSLHAGFAAVHQKTVGLLG